MDKLSEKEIKFIDEVLEYASLIGYVDFEKYRDLEDELDMEEKTKEDIQLLRSKIRKNFQE